MKIPLSQVSRDYLALMGESPDLLPLLEEGEAGAVLTLADEIGVKLIPASIEATLEVPALHLDEISRWSGSLLVGEGRYAIARMPPDYLKMHSVRMEDWNEAVTAPESPDSLRLALGNDLPSFMVCPERPMVTEGRDEEGSFLKIYGSTRLTSPASLLYIPRPEIIDGMLRISLAAYHKMLRKLTGK